MESEYWVSTSIKDKAFLTEYEILSELGHGVTSSVYKCKNLTDGTFWACKAIRKELRGLLKKVVHSEIDALLKLDHANIVRMKHLFETSKEVFLVLELADGGELFDRIVKKGHYSEKEAAHVVKQVLCALEYSHKKGIVHRDIKPENILYQSKDEEALIKLSDFGFARAYDESGCMQTFCGTIGYCAPEVILKQSYSPSVDIWSLGVVLYILLCGYEPFWDQQGEPGVTRRILSADYEFEDPDWTDISQAAKDLITQMLSLNPDDRPSAATALDNSWVSGSEALDMHLRNTHARIKEFNAKRKFKAATNAVMAAKRVFGGILSASADG